MKLIRHLSEIPAVPKGCAVTIGNFDGVHRGHQLLLAQLQHEAEKRNLPVVLLTFDPHPQEFFQAEQAPARLTCLREKWVFLNCLGKIDFLVCLNFNATLSKMSAEQFVKEILIEQLQTQYLLVGSDFHFGHQRQGDLAFLKRGHFNFEVDSFAVVEKENERISSTRLRQLLAQGQMEKAAELLGHPYTMVGCVARGAQRGRTIGFPTANIPLRRRISPLTGVFAVRVRGINGKTLNGVANIGKRPTVDGTKLLLEIHLFNFNQDIYGRLLCVEFFQKLRDEKKFDSFELLKQQIVKDAEEARLLLESACRFSNWSPHPPYRAPSPEKTGEGIQTVK